MTPRCNRRECGARLRPRTANLLFESAAAALGPAVLGVVLTGMGDDGLAGARAIHDAGGRTLTESESSRVVYGIPRAVVDAGFSVGEATIDNMADAIRRHLQRTGQIHRCSSYFRH